MKVDKILLSFILNSESIATVCWVRMVEASRCLLRAWRSEEETLKTPSWEVQEPVHMVEDLAILQTSQGTVMRVRLMLSTSSSSISAYWHSTTLRVIRKQGSCSISTLTSLSDFVRFRLKMAASLSLEVLGIVHSQATMPTSIKTGHWYSYQTWFTLGKDTALQQ